MASTLDEIGHHMENIDPARAGVACLAAAIPGFLAYALTSVSLARVTVIALPVGIGLCALLLYPPVTHRAQAARMLRLVAAELFFSPAAGVLFIVNVESATGEMAQAGAGAGVGIIAAGFVIGYPVAIFLFIIGGMLLPEQ